MSFATCSSLPMQVIVIVLGFAPFTPHARALDPSAGFGGLAAEAGVGGGQCAFDNRDFYVSHVSTNPANAGQQVQLFVRERGDSSGPIVLMLTGATQPAMVPFDLPYENYSWMCYLANAGLDVFAMDLQGYGFSTRPAMDDPCNVSAGDRSLLMPSLFVPVPVGTCPANKTDGSPQYPYPFKLTTAQSEEDEIESVVNYILAARNRETLSLIGWSQGGPRAGGYASRHPDKVDRLFLYAPAYNPLEPTDPPALPVGGNPLLIRTVSSFKAGWASQYPASTTCDDVDPGLGFPADPGVPDQVASSLVLFDPLAATWTQGQPLWRAPTFNPHYGWNAAAAATLHMPVLLIRGDYDTIQVPVQQVIGLYSDLASKNKVLVHVACAAHQLVWERQHMALLDASVEWLKEGGYHGNRKGCFKVGADGSVTADPGFAAPCSSTSN